MVNARLKGKSSGGSGGRGGGGGGSKVSWVYSRLQE